MPTVILICTLFTLGVETGQDVATVVKVAKAVHHHSTAPLYHHVLRPVGHTVHKAVAK
jgi:hypothetical protein